MNQHPEEHPEPEETPADETQQDSESSQEEQDIIDEDLPEEEPLTPELVEDEAIRGDFVLRWALVLLAFLLAFTEVSDSQTLVHIRTGQHLVQNGFLPPANDIFSYSASEQPWVNLSWFYDLLLGGIYSLAGMGGISFFKALIVAVTFYIISQISFANVSTWWGTICGTLVLIACYPQLTAQTEIVTLLGVSLTLFSLFRWRVTESRKYLLQILIIFLFWANSDPRMFLGPLILIFFALGYLIDHYSGRLERTSLNNLTQIGLVTVASLLIAMIHPFGWNTLLSPFDLYSKIYPAIHESLGVESGISRLQYSSILSSQFWFPLNPHNVSGLILVISVLLTFYLNRKNFQFSSFFAFLAVLLFAGKGSHEFAALSITAAVIATLNAQEWYKGNFRQTYSIATGELLFSRGGRALSVLALFTLAYMGIGGSLAGSLNRRIGVGIHPVLQNYITSFEPVVENAFDNRPFNFRPSQGDILIWHGQKVFIDSRMDFYSRLDKNFLKNYRDVRFSLLRKVKRNPLELDESVLDFPSRGDSKIWKKTFNEFEVTHVLPRLQGIYPDYNTFRDLMLNSEWTLTNLTASTAVFYRNDLPDENLVEYLDQNKLSFSENVFRNEEIPENFSRLDWARKPDSYSKILTRPHRFESNEEAEAKHHYFLLEFLLNNSRDALKNSSLLPIAYHVIHKSNECLSNNPKDSDAFRILGGTYYSLGQTEALIAHKHKSVYETRRRFLQSIQAFNQSLALDPAQPNVLKVLGDIYMSNKKYDLALDAYKKSLSHLRNFKSVKRNEKMIEQLSTLIQKLEEHVDKTISEIKKSLEKKPDPVIESQFAYQKGCVLHARNLIQQQQASFDKVPDLKVFQAHVLMEAGDLEQAFQISSKLEEIATQYRLRNWSSQAAYTCLGLADYERAAQIWLKEADKLEQEQVFNLIHNTPFVSFHAEKTKSRQWPLNQIISSAEALYQSSDNSSSHRFNAALSCLEKGDNKQAEKILKQILNYAPETPLRPIVRHYLVLVSGEIIDPLPPSERIPLELDTFYPEKKSVR